MLLISTLVVSLLWNSHTKENIQNLNTENDTTSNITVVSGYWKVKGKYNHDSYNEWFKNSLSINQRYIFFCDEKDIDYIKSFRNDYETEYIVHSADDFHSAKYATDDWMHFSNSPTKELSMIWHEKIHLMKMAKDYDDQQKKTTEFYVWIDSAIAPYRDKMPPSVRLNLRDVNSLPHDKICHSGIFINNDLMLDGSTSDRDIFSAGCIIIHNSMIDSVHELYYKSLEECNMNNVESGYCGQEQHILTDMKDKYPDLFHKMSSGWGANLEVLYDKHV